MKSGCPRTQARKRAKGTPSVKAVDAAVKWKIKRLLSIPLAAMAVKELRVDVDVSVVKDKGTGYRATLTMSVPFTATAAKKHLRHFANPAEFEMLIDKAMSAIVIEGFSGPLDEVVTKAARAANRVSPKPKRPKRPMVH